MLPTILFSATAALAGSCTDDQDMAVAANMEADMVTCMTQSQQAATVTACMEGKGFTAGCSACVGTYTTCVMSQCMPQCMSPTSDACKSCYTSKCLPAFETCTGLTPTMDATLPLLHMDAPLAGACVDDKDMALLPDVKDDLTECFTEGYSPSFIMGCMEDKGFSKGCTSCFGTFATCAVVDCMCTDPDINDDCKACYESTCIPNLTTCMKGSSELKAGDCDSYCQFIPADAQKYVPACTGCTATELKAGNCDSYCQFIPKDSQKYVPTCTGCTTTTVAKIMKAASE